MSLTPEQYEELLNALVASFDPEEFTIMFSVRLGRRLKNLVNVNVGFRSVVLQAIEVAEDGFWTAELIEKAMEHFRALNKQENPLLAAFLEKHSNFQPEREPDAADDYYKTLYVNNGQLFINRENLREIVKKLRENDNEPRTFLLKGSVKTGKTYSRQYISYLLDKPVPGRNQTYQIINIDLRAGEYTPYRIAETIGSRLVPPATTATIPQRGNEQESTYAGRLLDWIQGQINATAPNTIWWIVIDHFTENNLLKGTKELIKKMIERVDEEMRSKCRLVILDYQDNIERNIAKRSISTQIYQLERKELVEYLKQVFELNNINKTVEEIEYIVDDILRQVNAKVAAVPNGEEERGEFLNDAVFEAIERYKADKG